VDHAGNRSRRVNVTKLILVVSVLIGSVFGVAVAAPDVHARSAKRSAEPGTATDRHGHRTAVRSGVASIYSGTRAEGGSRTATGERVRRAALTAAHRTLPFGTLVRVTNRRNGHSVVVRINDRGPFVRGRVIDVTPAAARVLGFSGLAAVSLSVVGEREAAR
jgi:rare lipoprotein A